MEAGYAVKYEDQIFRKSGPMFGFIPVTDELLTEEQVKDLPIPEWEKRSLCFGNIKPSGWVKYRYENINKPYLIAWHEFCLNAASNTNNKNDERNASSLSRHGAKRN